MISATANAAQAGGAALGAVGRQVAAHIEPVTRFSAADLLPQVPEEEVPALARLALVQTVQFSLQQQSSPQRLPSGVRAVAGAAALKAALTAELQAAEAGAPAALQAWHSAEGGHYRRLLPAAAAFGRAPVAHGYEHGCSHCSGAGRVGCTTCSRRGRVTCSGCGGSRRTSCHGCGGSGRKSCSSCGGRGSYWRTETSTEWDSARNAHVSVSRNVTYACQGCGGSGQNGCSSCGQSGRVTCNVCGGQGETRCHACGGGGTLSCNPCEGSGTVHTWGRVQARVQVQETLQLDTADAVLAALVQQRVGAAALAGLGRLRPPQHTVQGAVLHSRYAIELQVRRAAVSAGGRAFVFHGLGPQPQVFDFCNVAGHLLSGDLQALERALTAGTRWRPGGELVERTRAFVESELNLAIAEAVSERGAQPAAAAEAVERQHAGMVDADYVARATTALRGAFGRLYAASLWQPALGVVAAGAVAAAATAVWRGPQGRALLEAAAAACAAVVLWAGLEWWARRRVTRCFPAALAARVAAQIRDSGTRRRWRLGGLLALAVAGTGLTAGVLQLPWVRRLHGERDAQAALLVALRTWPRQLPADFSLRQYPSEEQLQRAQAQGLPEAGVIRAWRALAPPPGRAVDWAAAATWLRDDAVGRQPLGRVARAVLALQQAETPLAQRRAALAVLNDAASASMVEARYWQARALLESAPPLRDAAMGLRHLTQAADRQHARAALLLGLRLAQGSDGRRDVGRARRYLTQAQRAGLPEAEAALRGLR